MVCWREARDAHAHHLEVLGVALDEVERNHGAVVEGWVPLALAASRETLLLAGVRQGANKLLVIDRLVAGLRRAKHREATLRPTSGGDVDVVRIHDGMRARDDHRVWRKLGYAAPHLVIRGDGGRNLLLARSHPRNDERWVRYGECGNNAHGRTSLVATRVNTRCGGWR